MLAIKRKELVSHTYRDLHVPSEIGFVASVTSTVAALSPVHSWYKWAAALARPVLLVARGQARAVEVRSAQCTALHFLVNDRNFAAENGVFLINFQSRTIFFSHIKPTSSK